MHVMGCVLAVPEENEAAYRDMAEEMGKIFLEYGALEVVENWEVDVPDGEHTDFRKAVAAKDGEKIVFSWAIFDSKESADQAHAEMMEDERMQNPPAEMPFDGKRMIFGGFRTIYSDRK
ncbi:DUF1428 domain-containing protein [Erythrobacter sp. HKB08]|uniref:DUF1428 domain-containing protein n=1 Tax=Erythrobacter sp. HKB08 TaxID=2502843 RepID=UPI0010087042|nr:DUF1428 domain-containing protein [Erythrobacter sp. HKB08]